ncbi:31904_t:CDS:2, partial [Racocetra persica]
KTTLARIASKEAKQDKDKGIQEEIEIIYIDILPNYKDLGDLSEKKSIEYLISKHKINEIETKKIYVLVGSCIVELKTIANDFLARKSFEVIKWTILDEDDLNEVLGGNVFAYYPEKNI